MLKSLKQSKQQKKQEETTAFTLLEMLISIIILGVLATIALPRFTGVIERTRAGEGFQMLSGIYRAQKVFQMESPANLFSTTMANLDVSFPTSSNSFTSIQAANDNTGSTHVGRLSRIGGTYTLSILANGEIRCTGARCGKVGCGTGKCN